MRKRYKRTERGWPGHFCCSGDCLFRRNTLLELGDVRIIVSTVGQRYSLDNDGDKPETVGVDKYYETMAFHAIENVYQSETYWDIDVERQVNGWDYSELTNWQISEPFSDNKANEMHEKAVKEIGLLMKENKIENV
jgi:hypothetical protein